MAKHRPFRYPQWIMDKLNNLSPGEHFVIPPSITPLLNETNFRNMLSSRNRRNNVNLKFHKDNLFTSDLSIPYPPIPSSPTLPISFDSPPQWWVWYSPHPKPVYVLTSDKLPLLNRAQLLQTQLHASLDQDNIPLAASIQTELDNLKLQLAQPRPAHKVYPMKGSITQPLSRILDYLHLTPTDWAKITLREQIKLRIRASIQITRQDWRSQLEERK